MHITIINSSPRKNGVTAALLESLCDGMLSVDGNVVSVYNLYNEDVRFCDGCFRCWYQHPGRCKIPDSFNKIYSEMLASDMVVIASPIYGMMINGILKAYLDRVSMVSHLPDFVVDKKSSKMVKPMHDKLPPVAVLLVGNMAGQEIFDASKLFFDEYFRITNTELIATISRHQSELLIKPICEDIKTDIFQAVKLAGTELVCSGHVTNGTLQRIQQDILDMDNFIQGHNLFWKICTRKNIAPLKLNFEKYPILKI